MHKKDAYSKFIMVVKLALPVSALFLVATIFFVSRNDPVKTGILFAKRDLANLAVGQKITNPNFSGVTRDGDAFSIRAEAALPDAPKPLLVELKNADSSFNFASGLSVTASASDAEINIKSNKAALEGDVQVSSSDGFFGQTEKLLIDFTDGIIESPGPISGENAFGKFQAGSMKSRKITEDKSNHLVFQNGVKLIYFPPKEGN